MEEVYFDELFEYLDKIKKRKINHYIMELAITTNPHIEDIEDRKALWDRLSALLEDKDFVEEEAKLDKAGFEMLRKRISENSRVVVK